MLISHCRLFWKTKHSKKFDVLWLSNFEWILSTWETQTDRQTVRQTDRRTDGVACYASHRGQGDRGLYNYPTYESKNTSTIVRREMFHSDVFRPHSSDTAVGPKHKARKEYKREILRVVRKVTYTVILYCCCRIFGEAFDWHHRPSEDARCRFHGGRKQSSNVFAWRRLGWQEGAGTAAFRHDVRPQVPARLPNHRQ